jgi:hypothetical protein
MIRMSRKVLTTTISVALSVRRKPERRALGVLDRAQLDAVTEDLVDRILGKPESETVILQPSMVGNGFDARWGKWDIDEPHPHPDLPFDRAL